MVPATLKKILADLWVNKARSILVALSIAVGVLAVGVIVSSMIIVKRDLQADYAAVNPHTARLYSQEFDSSLLEKLRSLPEVESVDASYNLWLDITSSDGKKHRINLNSMVSLDDIQVDRLVFESGSSTLADGEIYLERQGAAGMGFKVGDTVTMTLNNGQTKTLRLAGTVHDVQANPYNFNGSTSGFVTPATMEALGGSNLNNFVNLVTSGSHTDASHVRQMAEQVAEVVTANGITVNNVNVNRPGQPPAQSTLDTVMALMSALSILVVLLSTFLVTNTVSALMGQQVRQIGVMKALGATLFQVMGVYIGLVLAFGMLALLIGIPLGGLAAYALTRWLIGMLNANASPFAIPLEAILVQVFIGLVVPVLGALIPVIGGARRTIRQAISSYGLDASGKPGALDRLLEVLPWLPRPLILSLRNTFRRKARLVLTLATLTLGGAIFIAMLGVRESMNAEINQSFSYYQSDVNAIFSRNYPSTELKAAVADLQDVRASETWNSLNANVVRPDGENTDLVILYVPPDDTRLLKATMLEGRWLQAGEADAIVVSNHFMKLRPDVKIGDTIQLRYNKKDVPFRVVGFFRIAGTFLAPFTYITPAGLAAIGGDPALANQLKLMTDLHTQAYQEQVLQAVQARFTALDLQATLSTGQELITQQRALINLLISLLLVMGVLIAVVGGLGLMGTMGMNVLERTREIGVLRSIGAENGTIFQLVLVEGALIGLISWGLSALVAIPITQFLDKSLGQALMTVPITYIFSTQGLLIWLGVVLLLSTLASLLPARSAVRLTIRDVLAYE
jgi:putative ABC transport system permease protein